MGYLLGCELTCRRRLSVWFKVLTWYMVEIKHIGLSRHTARRLCEGTAGYREAAGQATTESTYADTSSGTAPSPEPRPETREHSKLR